MDGTDRKKMEWNSEKTPKQGGLGLDKKEIKVLQEAMYHATESGHLDITLDLKNLGVPWNTHIWTETLSTAYDLKRKSLIQHLLRDFDAADSRLPEDLNQGFIEDGLPLLFDIFRHAVTKNEMLSNQVGGILAKLYGADPIPPVEVELTANCDGEGENLVGASCTPRIDAKFVNNQELSDVKFLVDGKEFYAHRIVLLNANSRRFKEILAEVDSTKDDRTEPLEIKGVVYSVFEMMMEYLYRGKLNSDRTVDLSQLLQLLSAARQFSVDSLCRLCATQISRCLDLENCLEIYRFAVMQDAAALQHYCEGYFLQNLPRLMQGGNNSNPVSERFRKTVYSSGKHGTVIDLCQGLIGTLQKRLETRIAGQKIRL